MRIAGLRLHGITSAPPATPPVHASGVQGLNEPASSTASRQARRLLSLHRTRSKLRQTAFALSATTQVAEPCPRLPFSDRRTSRSMRTTQTRLSPTDPEPTHPRTNFLLHESATYKLLRERAKSKERGRGRRAATSRELRPKRERRLASGRDSGGQRARERAAASEWERERRPVSERERRNQRAGEREAAGERGRDREADWLRAGWRQAGIWRENERVMIEWLSASCVSA
ncbi:hypothetical protein FH972_012383 [Carpinus fangiana]|uniref:Uncharacterized protein n=1 Tax=Carpinus fangiana TaxID=176857 RepID=A0A5N6R3L6_9ROSI|nr:hypothetical protein FH972_012383 [Carpinus fangiana]